jgi:hypothetical protein
MGISPLGYLMFCLIDERGGLKISAKNEKIKIR